MHSFLIQSYPFQCKSTKSFLIFPLYFYATPFLQYNLKPSNQLLINSNSYLLLSNFFLCPIYSNPTPSRTMKTFPILSLFIKSLLFQSLLMHSFPFGWNWLRTFLAQFAVLSFLACWKSGRWEGCHNWSLTLSFWCRSVSDRNVKSKKYSVFSTLWLYTITFWLLTVSIWLQTFINYWLRALTS